LLNARNIRNSSFCILRISIPLLIILLEIENYVEHYVICSDGSFYKTYHDVLGSTFERIRKSRVPATTGALTDVKVIVAGCRPA